MKQALVEEYRTLKQEAQALRDQVNALKEQKDSAFTQIKSYSSQAAQMVGEIKDLKTKRDELTNQVKSAKEVRDQKNEKIKELRQTIKTLQTEKESLAKKHNIKKGGFDVKSKIAAIEKKIETDVLSFNKEKQLMKQLSSLKKEAKQQTVLKEVNAKLREARAQLKTFQEEADKAHAQTKEKASESQKLHERILEKSKLIKSSDKQKASVDKDYKGHKSKTQDLFNQLKEKQDLMNTIKKELDGFSEESRQKKQKQTEKLLAEKEQEVEQKIKRGEKLTTQDLLIFQGMNQNQ